MPAISLRAHFDGQHILLDDSYDLKAGAPLVVTVLPQPTPDERSLWASVGTVALSSAYGDDEPEYTLADLQ